MARWPSTSYATFNRSALSTPPEYATNTDSIARRIACKCTYLACVSASRLPERSNLLMRCSPSHSVSPASTLLLLTWWVSSMVRYSPDQDCRFTKACRCLNHYIIYRQPQTPRWDLSVWCLCSMTKESLDGCNTDDCRHYPGSGQF